MAPRESGRLVLSMILSEGCIGGKRQGMADLHIQSCYSSNLYDTQLLSTPGKAIPQAIIQTAPVRGPDVMIDGAAVKPDFPERRFEVTDVH